jgi:hypothetical protein
LEPDATDKDKKLDIVHHAEMLLNERVNALKARINESNLLRSCTSNMMVCGGDKSGSFSTNDDGTLKSSRCTKCLCWKPTCIFAIMTQTVASSRFGRTASGQFEHEHVVAVATMVPVFLMELVAGRWSTTSTTAKT